jgi:uncharacterized membrane protein YdjX (TVP38/TMEM64 family)
LEIMNRTNLAPLVRRIHAPWLGWAGWRWLVAGLLVAVAIAAFLLFDVRALFRQGLARVEALGPWGPILFVLIYVVAAVLFVPGSPLTLGAGAVFGLPWAAVYASIASTLAATAAFLVGRHLARDWVARKMAGNGSFDAIDRAVEREGWKIVLLTRLSPVFPFNLLNYAFGLTRVKLRHYVIASWIGMMPGTIMYVYVGSVARAGADVVRRTTAEWTLYSLGLVATVAVTILITRIARNALARRTGQSLEQE